MLRICWSMSATVVCSTPEIAFVPALTGNGKFVTVKSKLRSHTFKMKVLNETLCQTTNILFPVQRSVPLSKVVRLCVVETLV